MDNKILKVSLFNEISFEYQNNKYNLESYLTKQLLNLLEILILSYGNQVTTDSLVNILWQESENPRSSLKFHVFKLRKSLKQISGLEDIDFIITTKSGYQFKPNIECYVDTYIFQKNHLCIDNDRVLTKENLINAETIEKIYTGLLKHDSNYVWFLQIEEYYHNIYINVVHQLCDYYFQYNMNDNVKKMTLKATRIDPTNEFNHISYIQSLINSKEYKQAFEYYQRAVKMLEDVYAITLSDKMKELYELLINGMEEKGNVVSIIEDFKKRECEKGAFYCEQSIFNYIYDMKLRSSNRNMSKYYLFVFELFPKSNIQKDIPRIKMTIQQSLRSGDVFTRISKYQFLALLSCENSEIGHSIAQRITKNIRKKIGVQKATVNYYIDKVIDNEGKGK
ncbi:MAG: winged helix-turn-helix domain-containing protein [Coprobacillus sp.]